MTKVNLLKIEEMGARPGLRTRYTFHELNKRKEQIIVELSHSNLYESLGKLWKEKKWINKDLTNFINIDVFVIDEHKQCFSKYNPQITKNHKINFDWILEDNKPNRNKILTAITKEAFEEDQNNE